MANNPHSKNDPESQSIQLFSGPESPCGYLPEKQSRSVFIDPDININNAIFSELGRLGFRRSGEHLYRTQCTDCNACWSYRVLNQEFSLNKSQRRIQRANHILDQFIVPAKADEDDYLLYEKYISARHRDGEMYPPSFEQYRDFLFSSWCESLLLKLKDDQKTIAVICLDILDDGLSAVYSFFDPDSNFKSLGTELVLRTIALGVQHQLPYSYLGYFIDGCQKMSYKSKYQPSEALAGESWQPFEELINSNIKSK